MQSQIDFTGEQLKEKGLKSLETTARPFLELMREQAVRVANANGYVTSDDLREYADRMRLAPHHSNSWGGVFAGKEWKATGMVKSRRRSNHARMIRVWELAG